MPNRRRTSEPGDEHYLVRVTISGALLHLASRTMPVVHVLAGRVTNVEADWLTDPEKGDTVGFIDWSAVVAVTWRWTGTVDDDGGFVHRRSAPEPWMLGDDDDAT
jgi:hypothetical protein